MIDEKMIEDYVDQATAAKMLDVSRSRINKLCNEGRFKGAIKTGWAWLIPKVSVENFERLKRGVKPKPRVYDEKALLLAAIKEATNITKEGDIS